VDRAVGTEGWSCHHCVKGVCGWVEGEVWGCVWLMHLLVCVCVGGGREHHRFRWYSRCCTVLLAEQNGSGVLSSSNKGLLYIVLCSQA
jgi:hypothetical protein